MSILSAVYIKGDERKEYKIKEINSAINNNKLRGFLFCPTPNCESRVMYYATKSPFIKTWPLDNHIENCLHGFDRAKERTGIDSTRFIEVELSAERKKRALKEAYLQYLMTEEEKEMKKEKRKDRKNNPITVIKETRPSTRLVLNNNGTKDEGTIGLKGQNLPKRTVDMLKDIDKNKPRLIMAIIKSVELIDNVAVITVNENNIEIEIVFEEAFRANSPGYLGLFHLIKRYISNEKTVVFTGIGEIRSAKNGKSFELSVFYGEDFAINNMDLLMLAAHYARG